MRPIARAISTSNCSSGTLWSPMAMRVRGPASRRLGLAMSQQGSDFVRLAFLLGIGLHKLPEGLALGAIVRASMASHWKSLAACIAAEAMTIAGGAAGFGVAARMGVTWVGILLAAAGTFIYLGYHAIEGELHRRVAGQ